ncbi:MAG: PrsW family intramembrane metalloprotease [Planctomycetes bacterium]|nr:PrsW family intramembrane metalloprotease [Planctomycetota bacterium]
MRYAAFVACTLAPILFWFLWIRRKDAASPEPRLLLLRCYLLGGLSTLLVLALRPMLDALVLGAGYSAWRDAFLVTAPLEEASKLLAMAFAVAWSRHFDEPLDGIVYGACAALGFASVENVVYALDAGDARLATLRGFTATLAHVASSGIAGLGLALMRLDRSRTRALVLGTGFVFAVLVHGAYDLGLAQREGFARVALITVLPGTFVALGMAVRCAQRSGRRAHHVHS